VGSCQAEESGTLLFSEVFEEYFDKGERKMGDISRNLCFALNDSSTRKYLEVE
jgi:hypothetical protein